ncbi:hypothetical protein Nepgr_014704 [Nepenthes gracilis]|uniref:Uncharacterized protein n=1 Tax=Nepenthes gracilis TaxID=150966 RepID=A0AAD3SKH8_NEPGR|nr:hypothetical protein Nepgr_014704 [Nepenthes gracilis]
MNNETQAHHRLHPITLTFLIASPVKTSSSQPFGSSKSIASKTTCDQSRKAYNQDTVRGVKRAQDNVYKPNLTKFSTIQEELNDDANIGVRPTAPHSSVLQHVRSAISSASRPSAQMQRTEKKPCSQGPQIHQGSRFIQGATEVQERIAPYS